MINRVLSAFLSFALLIIFSGNSLIVLRYNLNKAEIIEKYCVNKDKPELCCEGKCHLEKQLKQQNEKEEQSPFASVKENFELLAFLNSKPMAIMLFAAPIKTFFNYLVRNTTEHNPSIFHPPRL